MHTRSGSETSLFAGHNWIFTNATEKTWQNETLVHIKNNVTKMTLTSYGIRRLIAIANETFVEGKHSQLWKIGQPDKEGYYTIQNFESQKLISNAEWNPFGYKFWICGSGQSALKWWGRP